MIAARTKHGQCNAAARAVECWGRTVRVRGRLLCTATILWAYLPPEMGARLRLVPEALSAPAHPSHAAFAARQDATLCNSLLGDKSLVRNGPLVGNGPVVGNGAGDAPRGRRSGRAGKSTGPAPRGRAAERLAALAEAEGQAPWRQAIAFARAAKRAARAAKRAAAAAGHAAPDVRVRAAEGKTCAVRHDLVKQSAMLGSATRPAPVGPDPVGPEPMGLRSGGENASRAAGLGGGDGGLASGAAEAQRPGTNSPSSGDGLLQREVAFRAAGLRARGTGPGRGEAASGADSALRGLNPMELSAALAAATGRTCLPAPGAGLDPVGLRPGGGAVRSGEGPLRRGLMSSTVCNEPMAHKVAALVGRAGGWSGRVTIRATQQAGQDEDPWVVELRKLGTEDARRLRARCGLRVGSVADVVRWDGLAGGGV
jgi:hypothetical protein